ncbi:spore germination protein GerPE [Guptibacillus algicola]|uniref:spore germination protein GerPE n=1 Tax=Guptibacillus algicola TaxID=225844 RepID=UPI001CD21979|nr:spore germination protein GerPE [Alkalihalobacillus algicola]MCA0987707.1 spore germination protein GerPE [Alkalihalobacillus algicola]
MIIPSRASLVNWIRVASIDLAGTVQIGDSNQITPEAQVYAVQRELPIFNGDEAKDLSEFPIYSQEIPLPPITECVEQITIQENPVIKVGGIDIIGVAASSVLHVGSTQRIQLESRVKNIREFFSDPNEDKSNISPD